MKKIPTKTACFVDLDHTLFDTDRFFNVDLRNALKVNNLRWKIGYLKARKGGFTLSKHIKALSLKNTEDILKDSFSDLSRYLFDDSIEFLEMAKEKEIPLFLISLGNPEWQNYKITASNIDKYFSDMFFTEKQDEKAIHILKYKDKFERIIVIDDTPAELDTIKDKMPRAETYYIDRLQSEKSAKHKHIYYKDLKSILNSLPQDRNPRRS